MKSYIVDRSSSTPRLNEMPTNVEKIYQTKEAAETALANGDIADGEFVSTVDTVTDTGDKFDKSYLSYSTEETLTGGTWIDGKPIYRKAFEMTNSTYTPTLNIPNIDRLVSVGGYICTTGASPYNVLPLPWVATNEIANAYIRYGTTVTLIIVGITLHTTEKSVFVLEYTKQ